MLASTCMSLLASSGQEQLAIIFVFSTITIISVASIIGSNVRRHLESAYNARLKQLMIERGMSAQEIETVVRAKPDEARSRDRRDRC